MDMLYTWIRNIVMYMILNTIIMNLLGNSSYKKYVSIISGMILVLIVISPFLSYFRMDASLDYYLAANEHVIETSEFKTSLKSMEEQQMAAVFQEYTSRIQVQVERILSGELLTLTTFKVSYDKDVQSDGFGEIIQMDILAKRKTEKEESETRITIEQIEIGTIKKGEEVQEVAMDPPSPEEISVKNKLSDFYNIEPDNINISVQGG